LQGEEEVSTLLKALLPAVRHLAVPPGPGDAGIDITKDLEYAQHEGQSLRGTLYSPRAAGHYPTVIAVHGGGWQGGTRDNYQHLGPWLARHGYVVFAVTYRLAKAGAPSYPAAVNDIRAAVQFVKGSATALKVDPARVALLGDSAGAHLAALVGLAGDSALFRDGTRGDTFGDLPTAVKVVAGVYGVYDLYRQWERDLVARPRDNIVEKFLGLSALEDKRPYLDASPIWHVSSRNNGTAFFLGWGDADDIVEAKTQSEAFLLALKQAGYFVRTSIHPGAPHFWMSEAFDDPGSFSVVFSSRLLRFLQTRL
jgi:acetyl esterase/lipase